MPHAHADGEIGLVLGETGIPTPTEQMVTAAQDLYLDPNGYTGTAVSLTTPEQYSNQSYLTGELDLVQTLESDYAHGDISTTDPAYVFGYSQSAVLAGMAEQQLSQYGIPEADLHFVLVGDDASAYGGMTNTFPWLFRDFGYTSVAGQVTPDQYYPTDVYTIPHDNWADAPDDALFGIPALSSPQHLEYLGVTAGEIGSAQLTHIDGLTDYYTLDPANEWATLITALMELWNVTP